MSSLEMDVIDGSIVFVPSAASNWAMLACASSRSLARLGLTREQGTVLRDALTAWLDADTPAPHVSHSAVQATGAEVAQQAASAPQAGMCSCGHDADEHHDEPGGDPCFGTDWDVSECANYACNCRAFAAMPADPTPPIRHERYMQLTTHSAGGLCTILRSRGHLGPLNTWSRHDLIAAILRAEGYGLEQNSLPAVQA